MQYYRDPPSKFLRALSWGLLVGLQWVLSNLDPTIYGELEDFDQEETGDQEDDVEDTGDHDDDVEDTGDHDDDVEDTGDRDDDVEDTGDHDDDVEDTGVHGTGDQDDDVEDPAEEDVKQHRSLRGRPKGPGIPLT